METIEIDGLTKKRVEAIAEDMRIDPAEVLKRAMEIFAIARVTAKGHEIDRRNRAERAGE